MKGNWVSMESYYISYIKTLQLLLYIFDLIKSYKVYVSTFETRKLKYLNHNRFESLVYANQDHNATMIIPLKVALRLSFSSGLWVFAKFFTKKLDYKQAQLRWVKIIVDYNMKKEDSCYISLILYHNLKEKLGSHDIYVEIKDEKLIYNTYLVTRLFSIWNSKRNLKRVYSTYVSSLQPKFACEVSLSFINDELKSLIKDVKDVESILQHYFTYPRYLHIGDVLVVPLPIPDAIFNDSLNYIFGPKFLYFYVESINGSNHESKSVPGYLVCKERTTLFLSGTKNIKIPYLWYCINSLEEVVPPCLQTIFNKIYAIFQSHYSVQTYRELKNSDTSSKPIREDLNIVEALDCERVPDEFIKQGFCYHSHILLVGPTGSGKVRLVKLLAEKFSYRIKWIDCLSLKGDTSAATERKINQVFSTIYTHSIIVLTRIGDLSEDKDGNADPRVFMALKKHFQQLSFKLRPFIVATVDKQSSISDDLWSLFTYTLVIECPTTEERTKTLLWFICSYSHCEWEAAQNIFKDDSTLLNAISHRTAGFFIGDLEEYILRVYRHYLNNVKVKRDKLKGVNYHLNKFPAKEDFLKILDELQEQRSLSLGLPRIPKVEWKDVGGLEDAKKELINTIELPIKHPNIISKLFRRSGILLYGPPGTGKTLLAKSVASECGLNFLSVKGPELLNMYIGQSEENVREVFGKAKAAAPCVLFFDEVDSLAPNRGRSGDSGGVMDRIVSALLAELDGVSASSDVFVLGATNRPDLLDPALLRPGRFEKHIFLGLPETREDQMKILKAVTSKIPLEETVSLFKIVDHLPRSLTGADFSALAVDAFYVATRRVIKLLQNNSLHTPPDDTKVVVGEEDFLEALKGIKPSVSAAELEIYQKMKESRALLSPT